MTKPGVVTSLSPLQSQTDLVCAMMRQAEDRSERPDYRGCSVHVSARLDWQQGVPVIAGYHLSDFTDGTTIATFVNGRRID